MSAQSVRVLPTVPVLRTIQIHAAVLQILRVVPTVWPIIWDLALAWHSQDVLESVTYIVAAWGMVFAPVSGIVRAAV